MATPTGNRSFPEGFVWGTATASYQIEGAVDQGGRGRSIWDTFSHTPGRVLNGDTGDVACDHFHRYPDDIALMGELGTDAYRFSFAWPRFQADGSGPLNPAGVDFYDRLIDGLLERGITPYATMYHWDLPQALEDLGGWPNRDTANRFAEYAVAVHDRFSDRVNHWMTLNEPWCTAFLGYGSGVHAPGATDESAALRAAHHLLVGHGLAMNEMRSAKPDGNYGIAINLYPVKPATDSAADVDAARRVDNIVNRVFLDPIFTGSYPADFLADMEPFGSTDHMLDGDAELAGVPIDFVGINYYSAHTVRAAHADDPEVFTDGSERDPAWIGATDVVKISTGAPRTAMDWEIVPEGLYETLSRVWNDYGRPTIFITENGAASPDVVGPDGTVDDQLRLDYLRDHFAQAHRAIEDGVGLAGYFVWSLLDNFEWALGYDRRFGLVHVDFETQKRTIKNSGRWYSSVTAANALLEGS